MEFRHNQYESPDILRRGREKLERGEVCLEAIQLGHRFAAEIKGAYLAKASSRWINERMGHGLFAEEVIEPGMFVGEYTGIVRKNNQLYMEPLNNYCYEYPLLDSIGRSYVIDATTGNQMRLINHSETPNLRPAYAFLEGAYHCIFLALCKIEIGTQLSYNYGKSYWYIRGAPEPM